MATPAPSGVQLRVPAELGQLPILRSVAEMIAMREDLDPDTIADVKLAVDEACAAMIMDASPGTTLNCTYRPNAGGVLVTIAGMAAAPGVPDRRSFGWHVLGALADPLRARQEPPEGGGYPTFVVLGVQQRRGSAG